MASSRTWDQEREALLQHLEGVFALAQVVASNAEEAVQLVEWTYEQAFANSVPEETDEERRVRLYRLVLQARSAPAAELAAGAQQPRELAGFRQRLAREFVDHSLPTAFATLPSEYRLQLMLADVHELEAPKIAEVLGISAKDVSERLSSARRAVRRAVLDAATGSERHLLETGLADGWEGRALKRMAEAELVALPPTLRPSIISSIHRPELESRSSANAAQPNPTATDAQSKRTVIGGLAKRAATIVLIVAVAGLLGYGFSTLMQRSPKANLIQLSANQAVDVEATFQTTSAEQAERYVYDRLGRRVTVPTIDRAALQGVSIRSVADGAEVPVLVYQDVQGTENVVVYIYSYAFLDRFAESLVLDRDILGQIEDEANFDLHDLGMEKALVWRRSDDIFVAITGGDADELRRRISYPA